MADAVVQLVARLPHTSGRPEDMVQNTINLGVIGTLQSGDVDIAMIAFANFYNTLAPSQTGPVASRISGAISRAANACQILAYATADLTGNTPFGSPFDMLNFTMGAEGASADLPEEVAVVVSYNGPLINVPVSQPNPNPPPAVIRPQQRRRGRMFVGPLNGVAGTQQGGDVFRPTPVFVTDLGLAFKGMGDTIQGAASVELGVWSKADAEVYEVVGGYVDNAWDIQRRRGVVASSRTPFLI